MTIPETQQRTIELDLTRASDDRAFAASLSSEAPVERSFGIEILEHTEQAVDLSRAKDGLALLLHHDPAQPVGMVEKIRLAGNRLRAIVRFFSTEAGTTALTMAREGLRTLSIGYSIGDAQQDGERDGQPVFRVRRWTPLEVSLVALPADATVGLGRSTENTFRRVQTMTEETSNRTAKREAERVREIASMGDQYRKYLNTGDVQRALEDGTTAEAFKGLLLDRMETGHTDTTDSHVGLGLGLGQKDMQRYSLARAITAQINSDWTKAGFERECSRELERITGRSAEGFYVPGEFWKRDFNVGTTTEAGNLVATDLRSDLFTDALRNALVLARMGVRILPGLTGNVDIPRKATASALAMLTEIGSASETAPTTGKLSLTPKRIGAYVDYSRQALIQSGIALESMLRDDLLASAATLIENQAINGAGTGANVLGIRNYTTIGSTTAGTNGAALAWSHLVDLESACADANASPGMLAGYVTNSKVRAKAKKTQRGTNLDFIIDGDAAPMADGMTRLNGYRAGFTNTVPSNLTKGTSTTVCSGAVFSSDWSMAVLALFGAPDVVVDPYTLSATGQIRVTLNQFFDFGLRQPEAFAIIEDILTA